MLQPIFEPPATDCPSLPELRAQSSLLQRSPSLNRVDVRGSDPSNIAPLWGGGESWKDHGKLHGDGGDGMKPRSRHPRRPDSSPTRAARTHGGSELCRHRLWRHTARYGDQRQRIARRVGAPRFPGRDRAGWRRASARSQRSWWVAGGADGSPEVGGSNVCLEVSLSSRR